MTFLVKGYLISCVRVNLKRKTEFKEYIFARFLFSTIIKEW